MTRSVSPPDFDASAPVFRDAPAGTSSAGTSSADISGADISGAKTLAADLAVACTAASIIGLFSISPFLLEHFGFAYQTSGGGLLSKLHPATFLALLALAFRCFASPAPLATAWRLVSVDRGVVLLLSAAAMTALYAIAISRTPFTGLIDTFVLPALCFLLLRDLNPTIARWIALAVLAVLCLNAFMAIYEFLKGTHLIQVEVGANSTADPTRANAVFDWRAEMKQDWRATALLGHPLVNALVVGCFIICLVSPSSAWLPPRVRGSTILLQSASLFAFGARTSLILTASCAGVLICQQVAATVARGARLTPRATAYALCAIGAVAIGAMVLAEIGFFDRTIARFFHDGGSATTRLTMFELFHHFSWEGLFFHPDKDLLATWQRLYGLEFGIESSWIGLALTYGFIITAVLVVGLLAFARSVVLASGRGSALVQVIYFVSVSGTASLSAKTTSYAMIVAMSLLFLRSGVGRPRRVGAGTAIEPAPSP